MGRDIRWADRPGVHLGKVGGVTGKSAKGRMAALHSTEKKKEQ